MHRNNPSMCFPYVAMLKLRPDYNPIWKDPQVSDNLSMKDHILLSFIPTPFTS